MYRLCQRYNLLLVEDDPYAFLRYPHGPGEPVVLRHPHAALLTLIRDSGVACAMRTRCATSSLVLTTSPLLLLVTCASLPADALPGLHGLRGAGSYLGLDTDGRVLRVDSFAKFLMPGAPRWLFLGRACRASSAAA